MNQIKPLAKMTQTLVAVARGDRPADLVIKGGRLVNVNTAEILSNMDVAIVGGRIALVGDASHCIGPGTQIIEAQGRYLAPGFMDGHIHVESSMITVSQYSKAVVPHGTTSIFMDPHEIANVLGMDGIKVMRQEGQTVPLRVYTAMPSCVPAAPGFEDAGANLGPKEIEEAMEWEDVAGLGEMMNFPGVLYGDDAVHAELAATLKAKKCITGHYSLPETGKGLNGYVASGIRCCHESVRAEDALAKMRLGMYAQLREGSAWHDVKETIKAITEGKVDARFGCLVSDDTHPHTLLHDGHLDHVVRRAIQEGLNPITAIQMVTLNVAECFFMSQDFGSISPGKVADLLILSDLTQVRVDEVFIGGELVARGGEMLTQTPAYPYPSSVLQSVHLPRPLTAQDLAIKAPGTKARVRVMEIIEAKVGTIARKMELPVRNGLLQLDPAQDLAKVVSIERHGKDGSMGVGLVKGFHLQKGAVASTVAHDSHNLLIVGTSDEDMALAGNKLAEVGGGMIAVADGEVLALLPLPIAGLMSNQPIEEVHEALVGLDRAWKALGSDLISPFMTMALLALPVLPELRVTNRGLIDTVNFEPVDLLV